MDGRRSFLSQAGKEILIKAVIQAIPTYTMSVFQLPKSLCKELNGLMNSFYWGHKANEKKITWRSWEKMGQSKKQGGMGFRDLELFNLAMLAKQGWRLIQQPNSLMARVCKPSIIPQVSFCQQSWAHVLPMLGEVLCNPELCCKMD
ncbi:hypothetical protein SLA2020_434320 [Shorea laevis]